MKRFLKLGTVLMVLFAYSQISFAQVGIGNTNPNAVLDINASNVATPANTDGILIPRIDDFPITNPTINQDGMLIFVTGNSTPTKGFYYWDNATSTWAPIIGVQRIDDLIDGKSDNDGTSNGSSVFLGINAGAADDSSNNQNVGVGFQSLQNNTTGGSNSALGFNSLFNNTIGNNNSAVGRNSLGSNTTGGNNSAVGRNSLGSNTTGGNNSALGGFSLQNNTTGGNNSAVGRNSLGSNTTGGNNSAVGFNSLFNNTTGNNNSALGFFSLQNNTTGALNSAVGRNSLSSNTTGGNNSAVGFNSLFNNTTGNNNSALGFNSLDDNVTGSFNTAVGSQANVNSGNLTNATAIGANAIVTGNNRVRIGDNTVTRIGGIVDWTTISDGRFKTNVTENVVGIAFIKKLRPVTYNLNIDAIASFNNKTINPKLREATTAKMQELQSGFIAQEVEKAANSVGYNFHGVDKPQNNQSHYGLRYAEFVVPLVKAMQEQQDMIDFLKKDIQTLKQQLFKYEALETRLNTLENKNKTLNVAINNN